ncbi:MAG TPA: hypothetical protein VFX76_03540, partial [Roseiflexaceae bacterium]|nr:hypothetical protein [Roseiflexaceae bacterium]
MIAHITLFSPRRWQCMAALLAVLFAFIGLRPAVQPVSTPVRVQQQLIEMAALRPSSQVSVIVQKLTRDTQLEALVVQLGGTVTKEIALINAFAADLPARAIAQLGTDPHVRWISLDAPVVKTAAVCVACIDTTLLANAYANTIGATKLWNQGPKYLQGNRVGVAVVDSGVASNGDFTTPTGQYRVVANVKFSSRASNPN